MGTKQKFQVRHLPPRCESAPEEEIRGTAELSGCGAAATSLSAVSDRLANISVTGLRRGQWQPVSCEDRKIDRYQAGPGYRNRVHGQVRRPSLAHRASLTTQCSEGHERRRLRGHPEPRSVERNANLAEPQSAAHARPVA
jgi:hypothetical protein